MSTHARTNLGEIQIPLEKMWFCPPDSTEVCCSGQAGAGLEVLQTQEAMLQSACKRADNPQRVPGVESWSQKGGSPLKRVGCAVNFGSHIEGAAQRLSPRQGCKVAEGPRLGPQLGRAPLNVLTRRVEPHLAQKWQATLFLLQHPSSSLYWTA